MSSEGTGPQRAAKPSGAAGTAAMRRSSRRAVGGSAQGGGRNPHAGIMKFYTDESQGIEIGPTVILIFSLSFIGCVVLLHIWGKLRG